MTTEFVGFISWSLVLRSIVLSWAIQSETRLQRIMVVDNEYKYHYHDSLQSHLIE